MKLAHLFAGAMALALSIPARTAHAANEADYVLARLKSDGYSIRELEVEEDHKPSHQLSRWLAPVGDLAQSVLRKDLVTMRLYNVGFVTETGFHYECVAGIGDSRDFKPGDRYVEVKDCKVSQDGDANFVAPKIVSLGIRSN